MVKIIEIKLKMKKFANRARLRLRTPYARLTTNLSKTKQNTLHSIIVTIAEWSVSRRFSRPTSHQAETLVEV